MGTPVAGRTRPELDDVVGMFVNTLVLRADLEDDPSFADLLGRTRELVVDALDHQELPFAKLVEALGVPRDPSRQPLVDALFSLHDLAAGEDDFPLRPGSARHDLELYVVPSGEGLACAFTYKTTLFSAPTIARTARHFEALLRAAVTDPSTPVSRLSLGDVSEIEAWNATAADFPGLTLHALVEEQVARTPDAVAVTFEGQSLTYRQLDERANQIAHRLAGLGAGGLVAICAERSLELVAGLLGILKAGAAYVPLDPSYPQDRLTFMLADAAAPVVLTQSALIPLLASGGATILPLDNPQVWDGLPTAPPDVAQGEAAYMIYTSGSTGKPKGVPNGHRGIVNRLDWMQKRYRLTADDVVLQKTPAGFDVSVWEFFWPLISGARLVLAAPDGHRDPAYLRDLINAERVTTLHFVPSMLAMFLAEEDVDTCASLRTIICSGEELPVDLAVRCLRTLPAELHNLYGPTEAAIDVSSWQCTLERLEGRATVPIGSPIQNITLHVLDRHGAQVPVGVPGELHIGGVGVALGYHDRPALTAERFSGGRYRTGDAARWLPDGTIEFLGRLDDQVKLRGLRIELGEIETALREKAGGHRGRRRRARRPAGRLPGGRAVRTRPGQGRDQGIPAGVHAALAVRPDGGAAPHPERQARPQGAARARPVGRRGLRPSLDGGREGRRRGLGRGARRSTSGHRRRLLRPRRPLAAGHPGRGEAAQGGDRPRRPGRRVHLQDGAGAGRLRRLRRAGREAVAPAADPAEKRDGQLRLRAVRVGQRHRLPAAGRRPPRRPGALRAGHPRPRHRPGRGADGLRRAGGQDDRGDPAHRGPPGDLRALRGRRGARRRAGQKGRGGGA
ncbi:hypothetical protein GCM10020219_022390 [Nonomuraea dietziae]